MDITQSPYQSLSLQLEAFSESLILALIHGIPSFHSPFSGCLSAKHARLPSGIKMTEYHMDDYGHWPECETCPRVFRANRFRDQHMNAMNHWAERFECETCNKLFFSEASADQHMTSLNHWRPKVGCESCNRLFYNQGQAAQHMNALGHWAPKIPCETCGLKFHTVAGAENHMQAQRHYKSYCTDCGVRFQNDNNLKMVSFSFS